MYPWLGQMPQQQQQQPGVFNPQQYMPWLMAQRRQAGNTQTLPFNWGGGGGGAGGGANFDLGSILDQMRTRFTDRFGDNQGLSGLWSSRSPTTFSPGGWKTQTTQGQGGGLFGGLLGMFR